MQIAFVFGVFLINAVTLGVGVCKSCFVYFTYSRVYASVFISSVFCVVVLADNTFCPNLSEAKERIIS